MKKILLVLDDETANLLAKEKNKSEKVRESIKYMYRYILPETIEGMRASYVQVLKQLKDMDEKLDFIARKLQ